MRKPTDDIAAAHMRTAREVQGLLAVFRQSSKDPARGADDVRPALSLFADDLLSWVLGKSERKFSEMSSIGMRAVEKEKKRG